MTKSILLCAIVLTAAALHLAAQTPTARLAFEVVSIKAGDAPVEEPCSFSLGAESSPAT